MAPSVALHDSFGGCSHVDVLTLENICAPSSPNLTLSCPTSLFVWSYPLLLPFLTKSSLFFEPVVEEMANCEINEQEEAVRAWIATLTLRIAASVPVLSSLTELMTASCNSGIKH